MAEHKYSFQKFDPKTMSRAVGRSLQVSTKQCIEIAGRIRGRRLDYAKRLLADVIAMKRPLPYKKYLGDIGHKKGKVGTGRYPVKACGMVLKLLESSEASAQFKGLDTGNMVVVHSNAHLGAKQWHYGRQRRRKIKRTHFEVVLEERGKAENKQDMKKEIHEKEGVAEKQSQNAQKNQGISEKQENVTKAEKLVKVVAKESPDKTDKKGLSDNVKSKETKESKESNESEGNNQK
ncbi:50S ribosomal protein L22 [Candidatus Woesearchaeota archaeon]|nr:50S ribosomal protein L22 [Candidatus Woesearchaeota archaeon]